MRASRVLREQREGILSSCVKINLNSPGIVEIAGLAGLSAVWICREHGSADWNQVEHFVRAAKVHDMDVIVRVSKGSYSDYIKVFECDAAGIMVPHVTSTREAAAVVEMLRFQPLGLRAVDGGSADGGFGFLPAAEYLADSNREKFIILQIESPEGLEAVEEIAAVPGFDFLLFGPGDFTHRIGKIPGEPAPETGVARTRVEKATIQAGKRGFAVAAPGTPLELREKGYGIVNLTSDALTLTKAWTQIVQEFTSSQVDPTKKPWQNRPY
jgi:4-hydroxy-2-oxoheptanedioate aldolase